MEILHEKSRSSLFNKRLIIYFIELSTNSQYSIDISQIEFVLSLLLI